MSYHQVELDFEQNLVKTRSPNIESSTARKKCYQFSLKKEESPSAKSIHLQQEQIIAKTWLYGPATCLKSRTIIYPCRRYRCSIPCPCLLCAHKKHPTCRVSSCQGCPCENCRQHFADHNSFHAVFHHGCKFCFQIIQIIPCFNFSALDYKKKKLPADGGCYDSTNNLDPYFVWPDGKVSLKFLDMWSRKREKWIHDEEDDSDMWCRHCNLLFWNFDDLRKHVRKSHLVTKIFQHYWKNCIKRGTNDTKCYQCSKDYSSAHQLQNHIDSVHYKETFHCETCGVQFSRCENLERHKTEKHAQTENTKIVCEECGKHFVRLDNLKRHVMIVHTGSGPQLFQCDKCGKRFNYQAHLTRHTEYMFNKDGSLNNECADCGKHFCTKILLKAHRNLCHSEDDSKSVSISGNNTLDTEHSLQEHLRFKHNPKKFQCFLCMK